MDEQEVEGRKCVVCNKEVVLALVGVGIGVVFILMGLDTIRRIHKEQATVDSEEVSE